MIEIKISLKNTSFARKSLIKIGYTCLWILWLNY